ncbi:MAG: preprotein translocase subunit SecA [Deltaproteobacteria bacterium]|nr:preprotein translocase subunit SecA [Deltaproteobacteria bacterium]
MLQAIAKKVFGTKNDRELKKLRPIVQQINDLEARFKAMSEEELKGQTARFRERLQKGETLDDLLPEAFATVREAGRRVLGMRHFDTQLIGGMVLHNGKIAEMKTGEGKTLVATLPVYLNALESKGVYVVTVNDYLARRDSAWMGRLYNYLGMSVGVIVHGLDDNQRREAYAADITYGTNNEFGFDYLRDNMKFSLEQMVQRELNYSIVDEVDSILIDEARTPLIISGPSEDSTDKYYRINTIIPNLQKETDYTVDEKARSAILTEDGVAHVEKLLNIENLYDPNQIEVLHHVNQALKAHVLFKLDVDYVVKDGEVIIVDEFTGRLMPGRRWSDGLHQAVEAKEGVQVENENQTLATITFQNYFRMFNKLAGMTGTADTEAGEFAKIYNLEVMIIPTNRNMVRKDEGDLIYKNERIKFNAVIERILELHQQGQPVLVGTISIEKSEVLAGMLRRRGIAHHVLNAKQNDKEAEIVAQAGRYGAVTISTNMAGRGTDILLGGNPEFLARAKVGPEAGEEEYQKALEEFRGSCDEEKQKVLQAGGLFILGTERHESRRIDNQLRGRAGRQGDPGESQFYISLEDDLMRIFGSDRISRMMDRLKMDENEPIFHPWITKAIANAQKKVEEHNFNIRKNLIEFDDVMNQQRKTVYSLRKEILKGEGLRDKALDMVDLTADTISQEFAPGRGEDFDKAGLSERVFQIFDIHADPKELEAQDATADGIGEWTYNQALDFYEAKEKRIGPELMRHVEKVLMLQTIDNLWKDHLLSMDHLREGIGLRGYAQKDPIVEYKREGFSMFEQMMQTFTADVLQKLFRVEVEQSNTVPIQQFQRAQPMTMSRSFATASEPKEGVRPATAPAARALPGAPLPGMGRPSPQAAPPPTGAVQRNEPKVGRNDLCPCGSGKKFKKCHGT